jgi:hypothetical protein
VVLFWIRKVTPSTVETETPGVTLAEADETVPEAMPELDTEAVAVPFI